MDARPISGTSDLGLLEVGDVLQLTGSFRDEAGASLIMLGILQAISFAVFDFQVTATPVPESVPEPGSLLLVATALAGLAARRQGLRRRPALR